MVGGIVSVVNVVVPVWFRFPPVSLQVNVRVCAASVRPVCVWLK